MQELEAYKDLLEAELRKLRLPETPNNLYEPIHYILGLGGKRIRPAILLLANQLFGGDPRTAMPAAIAIEVFHNFTLMHDDIMDQAPLRRGKATVHSKWNTTIAILSGDAMMVKAYEHLARVSPQHLPAALAIFNQTALEVCEGQQLDMDFESKETVSLEDYTRMITLKTAVLLGASLKLGALLAGASVRDQGELYDFGVNLGIAFQLQDDLLDCFGDQYKVGKQTGGDILSNKKTWLLLKAFEQAEGTVKEELMAFAGGIHNSDPGKVEKVKALYTKLGVDQSAREAVGSYTARALAALNTTALPQEAREKFTTLCNDLLQRES
jgi:geranylgeranyl diphosphate synthase type II